MKFTLSWLKIISTPRPRRGAGEKLALIGLDVESVEIRGEAESLHHRPLIEPSAPNADKLQVCKVDTGSGVVEVVCGPPTQERHDRVFAPTGSYIPGTGSRSRRAPCAGVVSQGMLVSERELSSPTTTRASSSWRQS